MCGICGIYGATGLPEDARALTRAMCDVIIHRGPDEDGYYADGPVSLGMRRLSDGKVVGYMVTTTLTAKAHVAIVQAMLRSFPAPPDCYSYGPVCVADSERGKGLAGAMFDKLRAELPGRPAITFILADNLPSLRAHEKMGMRKLGAFTNGGISYIALSY